MGAGQRSRALGEAHQAGTHSVSLRPSDTSCSPLTGHPLQTWRALSPRGASWARCTLGCEGRKGVCSGQHHPWDPSAQPPPSFTSSYAQTLFCLIFHSSLLPFLILLGRPPRPAQKTPASRISLTYFGTISAGGAGEATGTLEALGTGRAAFTWETSFSLWQRHQGAIRPER